MTDINPLYCRACRRQTGAGYLERGLCPACRHAQRTAAPSRVQHAAAESTPCIKRRVQASPGDALAASQTAGCSSLIGCTLCLTGIGAVIGIPLLIMSAIDSNKAMRGQKDVWTGECPHCGGILDVASPMGRAICVHCSSEIVVRNGRFWRP